MEKKLFKCEVCGQILEEGQLEDKCPKCGADIRPHRVCSECGNYKGKEVVNKVEETTK